MIFQDIAVLDETFRIKKHQYVQTSNDSIVYIGDAMPNAEGQQCFDGKNKLMLPGLVNAHTHVPMTLLRGYGENLPLDRWLNERIFPYEDRLDAQSVYAASCLGIAEMLRFGVTSFTEMYNFCEEIAAAVEKSGIKANISRGLLCFDDSALEELPAFQESRTLFEKWHNAADGRIKVDMCIHGEYTSTPKIVRRMAEYAQSVRAGIHIHLAETEKETRECMERHGMTPAEYMNAMGIFDSPTTAAHCVFLTDSDMDILAEKGVSAVHCPVSNLKLGSGVANVPLMLEKGVNVALGTDGCASNNNLNLFEELKLAALLHKGVRQNPELCTPAETLAMATVNGARAQGRMDTGVLKVGNKADFAVLDCDRTYMRPEHDALSNLVYAAQGSDVIMTVVNGRVLYQNGEYPTLDIEKITAEFLAANEKILNYLK